MSKHIGYGSNYPDDYSLTLCSSCGPNEHAGRRLYRSDIDDDDNCDECDCSLARQDHGYTIKNGYITDPGKFEHTPRYTPYFWYLLLDDEADDYFADDSCGVEIDDHDRRKFPELAKYRYVRIWEEDNGFVNIDLYENTPEECGDPDCGCEAVLDGECLQCGQSVGKVRDRAYSEYYSHEQWDAERKREL
jgi:hypothetical protein